MKIAIIKRNWGISYEVYQRNVCAHLEQRGVVFTRFGINADTVPQGSDLIWLQGTPIVDTLRLLRKASCPIVVTIHGVDEYTLPLKYLISSRPQRLRRHIKKPIHLLFWRLVRERIAAFITVSDYCRIQASRVYAIKKRVHTIHHGYDTAVFNEDVEPFQNDRPYLLHISNGKPKKNIAGIIQAFASLRLADLDLLIVAPHFRHTRGHPSSIRFLTTDSFMVQEELARLYRGAAGFVFPSFDETFGLPILEAMACACPVITSNGSACVEIAGDAAILVDPHNVQEIAAGMHRLITDPGARTSLVERARHQRRRFTWEASARSHLRVFRDALGREA